MAKDISIKVGIEDDGSIEQSVGGLVALKKELKAVKNELAGLEEGSEAFNKAAARAGELNNKIKDVSEATNAMTGEPVEKLSGSFDLLGSKIKSLDFKGAGAQLNNLKTAAGSIDFKSLVGGVKAFGSQMLTLAAELLVNPIFLLTAAIAAVGFAIYKAVNEAGEAAEALNKKLDAVEAKVNAFYDRQIKIAKARGKETDELEDKKLKLDQKITDQQIKNLEKVAASVSGLNDEQTKLLDDLREKSKNISADIEANLSAARKKRLDDTIKNTEKLVAETQKIKDATAKQIEENQKALDDANKKATEEREKQRLADLASYNERAELENKAIDELEAKKKKQKDDARALENKEFLEAQAMAQAMLDQYNNDLVLRAELTAAQNELDLEAQIAFLEEKKRVELENTALTEAERALIVQQYAQQEEQMRRESKQRQQDAEFQIASDSLQSLQSLSDLVFTLKMSKLEKGSAAELKAAQKQFNINKALAITSATISGIQGVVNALSAQSVVPEPYGTILKVASAVAVGVAAAANIAKISATKFNGGASGGGSATVPSASGGANVPGLTAAALSPAQGPGTTSTLFNQGLLNNQPPNIAGQQNNGPGTIKVQVTETDITSTQKKVGVIETQAKFG